MRPCCFPEALAVLLAFLSMSCAFNFKRPVGASATDTGHGTGSGSGSGSGGGSNNLGVNLLVSYSFSEASGTTAIDRSGNGNNATLSNTSWTASGHTGEGLSFNGTNTQGEVASPNGVAITDQFTNMAWIYPTNDPGSSEQIVLGLFNPPNGEWPMGIEVFNYNTVSGMPSCWFQTGTGIHHFQPASQFSLNTWTHFACTYDGSQVVIYVNGAVSTTTAAALGPIDFGSDPGTVIEVGYDTSGYSQFFQGTLDDLRMYNRVLSLTEIQQAMNTAVTP
jgi:hypothetical protein